MIFLVYEGLSHWGFFDYVHSRAERASEIYSMMKEGLTESSDSIGEFIGTAERLYAWLSGWIEPWRAVAYLGSALFLWWAYAEVGDGPPSPSSSPGASPTGSGPSSPEDSSRETSKAATDAALTAVAKALEHQTRMLAAMAEGQDSLRDFVKESNDESRASQLLRDARAETTVPPGVSALVERIEGFERILRADKAAASAAVQENGGDGAAGLPPTPVEVVAVPGPSTSFERSRTPPLHRGHQRS